MKKTLSAVMALCAALGWWGALYPQFTLVDGTYRIVMEETVQGTAACIVESEPEGNELYWSILDADSSRIRLKSRLLTEWSEFHESGNQ